MRQCPFCFGDVYYKYYFNQERKENMTRPPKINVYPNILEKLEDMRRISYEISEIFQNIASYRVFFDQRQIPKEKEESTQISTTKIKAMLYPKMDQKLSDASDPWITTTNFSYNTKICSASWLSQLFHKDKNFHFLCGLKKGHKWYIKKEAAINYFKEFGEGKVFKNTIKYLKERDEQWKKPQMQTQEMPARPIS
jgi:hypothetical protein